MATKQQSNTRPDALRFTVDSQLMGELGERLVTRNHVALAELIKNAYDADATAIGVEFCDYDDETTKEAVPGIILTDNGHGMRFTEVEKFWMRIATSNKARDPVSTKFGRPKTGNKGIGRFACQRLAKELVLTTIAKVGSQFERTEVTFQWADFVAGSTLTTIPCEYETSRLKKATAGTTLELIGLKEQWLQRDFNTLRRSVSGLTMAGEVRRKGFKVDRGFAIDLRADQFEYGEGLILDQLIDSGWGRLTGEVREDGCAEFRLRGNHLGGEKTWVSDNRFKSLVGVRCDISHFASGEAYELVRNKRILTKTVLGELRKEAGVRVYYESFRVFPMGERGDDWLGLERDAARRLGSFTFPALNEIASRLGLDGRTPLLRPRNENLVGKVFIGGEAGRGLQTKMNREGFVENESLRELVDFVRLAIEWMTVYYAQAKTRYEREKAKAAEREFVREVKGPDAPKDDSKGLSSSAVVVSALDFLAGRAADATLSEPKGGSQKRAVERAERVIETRLEVLDSEISVLRTLASTAPLLFTFAHEVSALIGRLNSSALRIESMSESLSGKSDRDEVASIAESLRDTAQNFTQMSELFGVVTSARQSERRRVYVRKIANKIISGARFSTTEVGIQTNLKCEERLKSPSIYEAELVSILINLYSNSIKSCMAAQRKKAAIEIFVRKRRDQLVIEVRDKGVGLPRAYWDEVFEPFCSDPADRLYRKLESRIGKSTVSALGRGSGLGLSIVKGICDTYGGSVEISKPDGWSLSVSASIPYKRVK